VGAIFSESFGPRARGHSVGHSDPLLLALCCAFVALIFPLALTTGGLHIALFAFCLLVALLIWREVSIDVSEAVPHVDFASLRFLVHDVAGIARYASLLVFLLLITAIAAAFVFVYSPSLTLMCLALCLGAILVASRRAQRAITRPPARMLAADLLSRAELDQRRRARDARRPARAGKGL
jgi:hypothetical protein